MHEANPMMNESNSPVPFSYFLEPGYIFIPAKPAVISTVLGSCVAVCIYDKKRKVAGVNHFQLPFIREKQSATARYGNVATYALIHMMIDDGSKLKYLEAQIFGGAYDPKVSRKNIGRENIVVARKILRKNRVRIVSEDVGGEKGRKIVFDTTANEIAVLRVDRLRKKDWYPYEDSR